MPSKSHNGQNQKRELKHRPPDFDELIEGATECPVARATDFWLRLEAEEQQRKKEKEAK